MAFYLDNAVPICERQSDRLVDVGAGGVQRAPIIVECNNSLVIMVGGVMERTEAHIPLGLLFEEPASLLQDMVAPTYDE
jgi:hypothetical protein